MLNKHKLSKTREHSDGANDNDVFSGRENCKDTSNDDPSNPITLAVVGLGRYVIVLDTKISMSLHE